MSVPTDQDFWRKAHARAQRLDDEDGLASVRNAFHLPEGVIYLDGNSLGPAPKQALVDLYHAAESEWAERLIRSWNEADWFVLCEQYGDLTAPLVGADSGEVVVCDTTSLNIYKAIHAALGLRPERHVIVSNVGGFPTDLYMLEGVRSSRSDIEIRLVGRDGRDLAALIDDNVAVVLIDHVDYRTGELRDMHALTAQIHQAGAVAVWDLCHSAGVVDVDLNAADVDFAVGCTYKYLNGGPGAPAFVFAATRHLCRVEQPLSGWWGHADPFAFNPAFERHAGIRKFLCGTQPILSTRALKAGLEIYQSVDMKAVRAKSMALTGLFIDLAEATCVDYGVELLSPRQPHTRGSQVALTFDDGYAVIQAMIEAGVIGDFRAPNVMRFGFAPLYLRFIDVCRAVESLQSVLQSERWRAPRFAKSTIVT